MPCPMLLSGDAALGISSLLMPGSGPWLGMLGPALFRRCLGIERLKINNEVAGFKFAVVGVLYAVVLGFAHRRDLGEVPRRRGGDTQEAARSPPSTGSSLGLEEPSATGHSRTELHAYAALAIEDDWPAMNAGHYSHRVTVKRSTACMPRSSRTRRMPAVNR